jgi:hypothetical protein
MVRIEGLRETTRALRAIDDGRDKAVRLGLKAAAIPVSADANRRLDRYQSIGPIVPGASLATASVFIRQSKRKVTGKRADFGALQMRKGLIPAAREGEAEFTVRVDEAIGFLIHKEGL